MQLKQYQAEAMAVLRRFFEEARMAGPKNAYETITKESEYADRLGRYGGTYRAPLTDLPNVPYVCLRLPTATDKFYPDFVVMLNDGRLLVVEYKGAHIADGADTMEKRTIGELWQRKSKGRGLFLVVEKLLNGWDVYQQLIEKTRTARATAICQSA